jgi:hypothetical protein
MFILRIQGEVDLPICSKEWRVAWWVTTTSVFNEFVSGSDAHGTERVHKPSDWLNIGIALFDNTERSKDETLHLVDEEKGGRHDDKEKLSRADNTRQRSID